MRREWDVEDGVVGTITLALNATDEGIILDVFNAVGDSVLTEAMTADEWISWMLDRDEARRFG